ncbi:hypothetical protein M758_11G100500 [Ceratodon purpureus]|nr:hypothetical protein M758_11G100500 [Ceratodon purpureus]
MRGRIGRRLRGLLPLFTHPQPSLPEGRTYLWTSTDAAQRWSGSGCSNDDAVLLCSTHCMPGNMVNIRMGTGISHRSKLKSLCVSLLDLKIMDVDVINVVRRKVYPFLHMAS